MAQQSAFWTSNATGDGPAAGYDQDAVRRKWHALFANGEADSGVQAAYEDALIVTTTAGHYHVAAGFACVYGFMYENTAAVDFDVVSPVGATRIDRIVLQASWAAQTVRLAVLTGDEGGAAPSLTQTASTTWEIPLAQASVTTGGAITLTDQREYLGASTGTAETSAATPATLVLRDANARAKMAAHSAATDIAILSTVTDHAALTTAHGAVSAATASKIIVRDSSGRAQVAAPSADEDIARLDTFKDLRVAVTTSSTSATVIPASWTNNLTLSGIVNAKTCLMEVTVSVRWDGSASGSTLSCRLYYDGASYSEQYDDHANSGVYTTTTFHFAVAAAAGTHSVVLQLYGETATVTVRSRRMTCVMIPTGA